MDEGFTEWKTEPRLFELPDHLSEAAFSRSTVEIVLAGLKPKGKISSFFWVGGWERDVCGFKK